MKKSTVFHDGYAIIILIGLAVLIALPALCSTAAAREFNPQGWRKPDIFGARRYQVGSLDMEKQIPGNETQLEKFRTPKGGRIYRYSHDGHVFSFEIDHDLKDPLDYEIVDFDGDGVFEIMQSPYDDYPLPKWTYDD